MSTYVILLPGDESAWENATPEQRRAGYDAHTAFAAELEKRGHRVVGGAELTHSRDARTIRPGSDGPVVSDGPYAELAEQVTGFYIVESDDPDDLVQVSSMLVGPGGVEIRGTVDHEGQG